ncbi:MAG: NAD(P)H-hydrate dehydratase [Candidatus Omnitrophica bacterium]|nr:NAD(P)H-hydrate dehydratase [Candidatus Omnitrophota bacterium]
MIFELPRKFPLLPRKKNTDKSRYGHVLVVGGSKGLGGAPTLACSAALRSGAGLVTLGAPEILKGSLRGLLTEAMQIWLSHDQGAIALSAKAPILRYIRKRRISAVVLGPGLSVKPGATALARKLVREVSVPIVLDADGLNSFRGKLPALKKHACPLILTPHRGEFERLFGEKVPENPKARAALAKKLAKFYDGVLVLKGHETVVADPARAFVNHTGNPGMAKGGTGDVLAGVIASFVAQGLLPFQAAAWGVYFHGLAGDLAVRDKGELGLTASDLIDYFPKAYRKKSLE